MSRKRNCPPNPYSLLLYLRTAHRLTIAQLSKLCHVGVNSLCQNELRGAPMGIASLRRLAEFFHISLHALASNDFSAVAGLPPIPQTRTNALRKRIHARQAKMEEVGDLGEDFVAALEREKLKGTPFEDKLNTGLADDLKSVCDMMTFDPATNTPIPVEVKSTTGAENEPIYFSAEEFQFLTHCAQKGTPYALHRVYHVGKKGKTARRVYSAAEALGSFTFTPASFVAWPRKHRKGVAG